MRRAGGQCTLHVLRLCGGDADAQRLERVSGATNYLAIERSEQMGTGLRRLIERAIGDAAKAAALTPTR